MVPRTVRTYSKVWELFCAREGVSMRERPTECEIQHFLQFVAKEYSKNTLQQYYSILNKVLKVCWNTDIGKNSKLNQITE